MDGACLFGLAGRQLSGEAGVTSALNTRVIRARAASSSLSEAPVLPPCLFDSARRLERVPYVVFLCAMRPTRSVRLASYTLFTFFTVS